VCDIGELAKLASIVEIKKDGTGTEKVVGSDTAAGEKTTRGKQMIVREAKEAMRKWAKTVSWSFIGGYGISGWRFSLK
jgi:hypothetical protein